MPESDEEVLVEEVEEVSAPPVPASSTPSGTEVSGEAGLSVEDLKTLRAELRQELQNEFDERLRQFQKGNDKRFSRVDNLVNVLKRAGVNVKPEELEAAQREMEIDEVLEERRQGSVHGRTDDSQQVYQGISTEILDGAGIAYGDPDYKEFVAKYNGKVRNPEHWRTLVNAFVDRKKRQAAAPNPASAIPESRSTQPTKAAESDDELRTELNELLKKSISDPKVRERRAEIQAALKARRTP